MAKKKMSYGEMVKVFCKHEEANPKTHLTGCIVFRSDNWPTTNFSLDSRTYIVSSDNKAFKPNMGGYSIYGTSKDLSDCGVRLERYMYDDKGGKNGWKVDYCYME